jgi:Flp pilus assembly protein protease CpaA
MIDFMIVLILLAFLWIIFAIVQDMKSREIANWLNFSLIIFALAFRILYSIFAWDYRYILFGLFGLVVFFIVGNIFYYCRLFAGGDAKLLIALGAIIPLANNLYENCLIFLIFTIALLAFGGIYSLVFSGFLANLNRKKFTSEFLKEIRQNTLHFFMLLFLAVILAAVGMLLNEITLYFLAAFIILLPVLYFYTQAIEKTCMIRYVNVKDLTVGDWTAEKIIVNLGKGKKKKIIEPNWEGLSEEELSLLKNHYQDKVLVKQGIPFSPSFLFAILAIVIIRYYFNGDWRLF